MLARERGCRYAIRARWLLIHAIFSFVTLRTLARVDAAILLPAYARHTLLRGIFRRAATDYADVAPPPLLRCRH